MSQQDLILLDRSGSMGTLWAEAISSINTYARGLSDNGIETKITLAVFDTDGQGHLEFRLIRDQVTPSAWQDVKADEAPPRGMTPLNDATVRLISLAKERNAEKTAIIIMTDGQENSSREYPRSRTKEVTTMLDELRAAPRLWQVIFLGASFDNVEQARAFGATASYTIDSVAAANLGQTMNFMSNKRSGYSASSFSGVGATRNLVGANGGSGTMEWTDAEKAQVKSDPGPGTGGISQATSNTQNKTP